MDKNKLQVEQYLFDTEEEYELAQSEKKKIQYIDRHLDYGSTEQILLVYQKVIETKMLQTPVGYAYLDRLYRCLIEKGVDTENLPAISIKAQSALTREEKKIQRENRKLKEVIENGKRRSLILTLVCVALAVAVGAMFAIAFTADSPNILNYENAILDKYSSWEQELTERENAIREKELELEIDE